MSPRKISFVNDQYYHIYNRGTEKRKIFGEKLDLWRFIQGMLLFNRVESVGSIRDVAMELGGYSGKATVTFDYDELVKLSGGLVEFVAVCLNPNHYHFLVKQVSDGGISKFMHRLGSGYTRYFNEKNQRNGVLFQGKFKAVHIETNEQLLYTSAYVGLNYMIHNIKEENKDLVFSSWEECGGQNKKLNICKGNDIILDQFKTFSDYENFAKSVVETARDLKKQRKTREDCLE